MTTAWFCFLAAMITVYVVLDGFDLGVGALHLLVARDEEEREAATAAIGPVWNGNEVWLIASGGVLFLAFPKAYAAAFSGLYFGLIIVLWLLVGRGLALELRHQIANPLWRSACDAVFALSSGTLALVFGVALGNVVRGVPLGPDGYFHLTFFQSLNWYALLIGVFGLVALCAALGPEAELHLIDPFGHHPTALPSGWGATERASRRVVARAARHGGPRVIWHVERSEDTARSWTAPVDLVFVDGDHAEDATRLDWELWHAHIAPGGHVLFHDAREGRPDGRGLTGPTRVVDELFRGAQALGGWSIAAEVDRTVAVRKNIR